MSGPRAIDRVDVGVLRLLSEHPRPGMLELARRLGIARGTAIARLERLLGRGIVAGFAPTIDLAALGYEVQAFSTLEVAQGTAGAVVAALTRLPQVLEVMTVTGAGDLLVRVAASSNHHLQEVLDALVATPGVTRTNSVVTLTTPVPYRVLPLLEAAADDRR